MSRKIEARGTSLEETLALAVADLLDGDPVKVRIDAPGSDRFSGRVRLELTVDGPTLGDADAPVGRTRATQDEVPSGEVEDDVPPSEPSVTELDRTEPEDDVEPASDTDRPTAPSRARGGTDRGVSETRGEPRDRDEADEREDDTSVTPEELDEEADAAADFLEGLLDALDLPGDLRIQVHEDHVEIEVIEIGSGALIGRRGQTLEAIQELLRCSLQRQFQRRARVKVDAEGYRARRLEKLLEKAEEAIDAVLDTGEPERLEPMDVFERKAVHQLVADVEGLVSRSQGREPGRRVVIERE
jgi:spoIIIJ-associated protein